MGGKHKQAQRIKNNARPSSSGRSAELLASSSQMTPKEIRFVPPTLSLMKTEEFDTSVSPAFQIVFKKMNKKDCTTKIKALQEFGDLISSSEAEAVKTILGFWATLYGLMVTDTDHRVREAVHNAHYQIILKDKKMIAPFLKQLVGPWFTSQYDSYPPAASAASKAFTTAFPQAKFQDCVIFCQKEILTYIYDNLTSKIETGKTVNEEAEAKFERVIISSLQGYCLYLDTLTDEHIQKCLDLNRQIISNPKFLKLATHKNPIIRATWFRVLATLYHKAAFLLADQHGHVVPVVFNNLDEGDPTVVGHVWEAALLIMDSEQEWWKHINADKVYFSKLKKVLREGGQGNASAIYPNLLSYLHKLPPSLRADHFYDAFFESLRFGLKRRSVLSSRSESAAVVTATIECLQYAILTNKDNKELCEKLIKSHLLPLIDWSLKVEQSCYRTVFHQVALLVQYWNRNKNSELLELFWSLVTDFDEPPLELADRQVTFIEHLKTIAKPKEHLKVKFSGESETVTRDHVTPLDQSYFDSVTRAACKIVQSYVRQIEEKQSTILLQNLLAVIRLFQSREFLLALRPEWPLADIYHKLLHPWLQNPVLSTEIIVDLTFILMKYLEEGDKRGVLETFLAFGDEIFTPCIKNALSHPYNQDGVVQKWLREDRIGVFLVGITESNLSLECPTELKTLFKLAFTTNQNGELLISEEVVLKIIAKLEHPLLHPEDFSTSIDACAHLASYVTDIIYNTSLSKCGDDLLLSLFQFSCVDHSDLEFLTEDTQFEINTSWQDVVTLLSKTLEKLDVLALLFKFARLVEVQLLGTTNVLTDAIVNVIRSVFKGQPEIITDVFRLFFDREVLPTWKSKIIDLCSVAEHVSGSLRAPLEPPERNFDISDEDILRYFVWSVVKVSVLSSSLHDDEEEKGGEIVQSVAGNKYLIADLLFDVAASQSFLRNYKTDKFFAGISSHSDVIKTKTKRLIEINGPEEVREVLTANCDKNAFLWSCAIYIFEYELLSKSPRLTYFEYVKNLNYGKLHLTQLFGSHLSFDDIEFSPSVLDSAVTLRSLAHCDEIDVQIAEVFEKIKKLRSQDIPRFLLDNKDVSWDEMATITEVIRLFSHLVSTKFDCLSRQHWDLGVICLSSWATNCNKLRGNYQNEQIQALIVAVCDFYIALNDKMAEFKVNNVKNQFTEEWEDVFLPEIHADLLQLWMFLADQFVQSPGLSLHFHCFVQEVGRVTDYFVHKYVLTSPTWTKILKRCTNLLVHSSVILQLWGYKMLVALVPGLIEMDLQSDSSSTPNTKGFTIEQFKDILVKTNTIVDGVLAGFKLGEDSCQVEPFTDSYTYVYAYLLLWGVLFSLCERSPSELRYQYADWLRNDNYFKSLLTNLFKLMPTEILHYSEGKAKAFMKMFLKQPNLSFKEPCTSEQLEHVVCWIYAFCLSQLPALVRQWWSETETKVSQIVEKVTSFYVSPQLCNQELQDVAKREHNFKNMTIKIIPSVREVIAIYTVDEAQMELVITLPQNYPLGGPNVRCTRQIGGPLHKQWLMQLKKYLLHQNGRVWDGLALWNGSLDKKFDGVEECYICFAVLHPGTYQLPKLSCQTCKKKFHSGCLYKWFSTSNKSSCPICRNLF